MGSTLHSGAGLAVRLFDDFAVQRIAFKSS